MSSRAELSRAERSRAEQIRCAHEKRTKADKTAQFGKNVRQWKSTVRQINLKFDMRVGSLLQMALKKVGAHSQKNAPVKCKILVNVSFGLMDQPEIWHVCSLLDLDDTKKSWCAWLEKCALCAAGNMNYW